MWGGCLLGMCGGDICGGCLSQCVLQCGFMHVCSCNGGILRVHNPSSTHHHLLHTHTTHPSLHAFISSPHTLSTRTHILHAHPLHTQLQTQWSSLTMTRIAMTPPHPPTSPTSILLDRGPPQAPPPTTNSTPRCACAIPTQQMGCLFPMFSMIRETHRILYGIRG